jgi:hypothetical protein
MQNALTAKALRRKVPLRNSTIGEIDWRVKELLRFVSAEGAGWNAEYLTFPSCFGGG